MKHGYSGYTNGGCRCETCRQAAHAYEVQYRGSRMDEYRAYQAEYRRVNKDKKLAYLREYRQRNRDALRAREASAQGRMKRREREQVRKARKLGQLIERVDPRIVYQMHGGRCGICSEFVGEDSFHVDHVIPLSKGGPHGYINVQPAHPTCNIAKGARAS